MKKNTSDQHHSEWSVWCYTVSDRQTDRQNVCVKPAGAAIDRVYIQRFAIASLRIFHDVGECVTQLHEFDQTEFFYDNSARAKSSMDDVGYIYVPSGCQSDDSSTYNLQSGLKYKNRLSWTENRWKHLAAAGGEWFSGSDGPYCFRLSLFSLLAL